MDLKARRILVGGGATNIGRAAAVCLAAKGARVAVADLNLDGAQETAAHIRDNGGDALAIHFDQSDGASVEALVQEAVAQFGGLDGLFANAADLQAIKQDSDLLAMDFSIWERTLQVNLSGTMKLIRACLPHLLAEESGSIVCTSSGSASMGENTRPAYAASKAAINALCRHVAHRWGSEGIRCNALSPGAILTEQTRNTFDEATLQQMLSVTNSDRLGEPEDIASAVAFLMSDESHYVNGQVWHINGGIHLAG